MDLSRVRVRNGEDDNFHFEALERRVRIEDDRNAWGPAGTPDILLDLVGVSAAVDEDVLDTSVCEELEGIFNQGGVCEWE